jgi:F0F1-type ATP synthase membrane subunit b/b'
MAAETERLKAITQSDREKVKLAAKAEIEAAERAARVELKKIAANLAVDGAESLLTAELTPRVQESLVAAFVKSLEGRPN